MESKLKIIAPVIIVSLVAVAVVMSVRNANTGAPSTGGEALVEQQSVATTTDSADVPVAVIPSASVSGNVDDMINVLTGEAGGDAVLAASVADGAAAVKNDTQEVNSLTTAYDETTF